MLGRRHARGARCGCGGASGLLCVRRRRRQGLSLCEALHEVVVPRVLNAVAHEDLVNHGHEDDVVALQLLHECTQRLLDAATDTQTQKTQSVAESHMNREGKRGRG